MIRRVLLLVLGVLLCSWTNAGAGVLFNSTTDRLEAATFTVPTTGSLCFNAYPNWAQTDNAEHYFFRIRAQASPVNAFTGEKATTNAVFFGWITGNTSYRVTTSTYTLNQSAWNVFCLTWDDTANETKLYLNGSQIGSTVTSLVTHSTASVTWTLGNQADTIDTGDINMDGRLAEFAIWNRVLNSTELTNRANGLLASCISSGLVSYWPLQNTSDLTDHAGSEDLTNSNVTDAADHPTTTGCSGGGFIGGGFTRGGMLD